MSRQQPIPEDKRAAIEARIAQRNASCRALAREFGVAPSTISKIAKDAGLADAFARSEHTAKATRAHQFDAKAARTRLVQRMYVLAEHLAGRVDAEYTQIVNGRNGPELLSTKLPPARDARELMVAAGVAMTKAADLERFDSDDGAAAGRTMLNELFGKFQMAAHQMATEEAIDAATGEAATGEAA